MELSERLRELIDESGHNVSQIAKLAGLSGGGVSFILSGKHKNPKGQTLSKLAKVLGVTVDDLLHGSGATLSNAAGKYHLVCLRCGTESGLNYIPHFRKPQLDEIGGWIFACDRCAPLVLGAEVEVKYNEP